MRFAYVLLVLILALSSCAPSIKTPADVSPRPIPGYVLPESRPGDEIVNQLKGRLAQAPDDGIAHRDLGSIYQSRTLLVKPPERWELVRLANEHLNEAFAQLPEDPQTLIFLGLARASRGKLPETNVLNKLTLALEGFALMDKAVAGDPENFSLRLVRAKAAAMAPAILGRNKVLMEDYSWLYEQIMSENQLPKHLRALGYLFLGDYHQSRKNLEKARLYWVQAQKMDTHYKKEAQERMTNTPDVEM